LFAYGRDCLTGVKGPIDSDRIGLGRVKILEQWNWREVECSCHRHVMCGGLPIVGNGEISSNDDLPVIVSPDVQIALLNREISPQLPLGSVVRASYEFDSRAPQHQRDNGEQPFPRFNSENRDLRSVLAAVLALWIASNIYWRGWRALGWMIAAYGIFGLMLRVDLWSLAIRVI
jgi:hypothetical protein